MQGETVTGLIDFYFACNDIIAYDLAVTHAAWCLMRAGRRSGPIFGRLLEGYEAVRPLSRPSAPRCRCWRRAPRCALR
jgi:homoserine kinase type II